MDTDLELQLSAINSKLGTILLKLELMEKRLIVLEGVKEGGPVKVPLKTEKVFLADIFEERRPRA